MNTYKKILLSLVFFMVVATQLAFASDAVIAYASNNSNIPSIRFWNSSGSGGL